MLAEAGRARPQPYRNPETKSLLGFFTAAAAKGSQGLPCWLPHLAPEAPHNCQVTRAARNVLQNVCTHAGASRRGTLRVDGMHRAQHRGQTSEGQAQERS